jgi:hypothetical protein
MGQGVATRRFSDSGTAAGQAGCRSGRHDTEVVPYKNPGFGGSFIRAVINIRAGKRGRKLGIPKLRIFIKIQLHKNMERKRRRIGGEGTKKKLPNSMGSGVQKIVPTNRV